MKQIKESVMKERKHQRCNCFLFAIICHVMDQGWLLDKNKRKVYTLDQLATGLCELSFLEGKPKVILVQEYSSSKYLTLTHLDSF